MAAPQRWGFCLTRKSACSSRAISGDVVIAQDGTGLRASLGPRAGTAGLLEHWHYDTFRTFLGDGRGGASYFMFRLDGDGKASRVMMNGDDGYNFERVEPHK